MKNWISQIKEEANPNVIIYLVGNKIDLPKEKRVVKIEAGQKIADEFSLSFKEASAKNGDNVNQIFEELVEQIDEKFYKLLAPKNEKMNKLNLRKKKHKKLMF